MAADFRRLIDEFESALAAWRRDFFGDDEVVGKLAGQRYATAHSRLFTELVKSGPTIHCGQRYRAKGTRCIVTDSAAEDFVDDSDS